MARRAIEDRSSFEVGARLVEGRSRSVGAFPRMAAGIEAARPAPRIFVVRDASALGDRAFITGFRTAAAGEGGHVPTIPQIRSTVKPLQLGSGQRNGPSAGDAPRPTLLHRGAAPAWPNENG
jgi:hypothetical protein